VRRREFIALIGAAMAPLSARGQQRPMPVIGFLGSASPGPNSPNVAAFRRGLSEAGYVEGQNVAIEYRWAEGQYDRLPALAADLVRQKVAVIFAPNTVAAVAAKQATGSVPIVIAVASDPIERGLIASLARPGGNITGTSSISRELNAKRLQLLKEAFPQISRMAIFASVQLNTASMIEEIHRTARALGLESLSIHAKRRDDFEMAFVQLSEWHADSMYSAENVDNFDNRRLLVDLAARARMPAIFPTREYVESGGLVSYGTNYEALYRRAAAYVDKILKGAKPADLPVEQPTRFELLVNMKTANALGLTIPPSILALADEVIE
jgi:putative ABC transport system substrate-binding protein